MSVKTTLYPYQAELNILTEILQSQRSIFLKIIEMSSLGKNSGLERILRKFGAPRSTASEDLRTIESSNIFRNLLYAKWAWISQRDWETCRDFNWQHLWGTQTIKNKDLTPDHTSVFVWSNWILRGRVQSEVGKIIPSLSILCEWGSCWIPLRRS